MTATSRQQGGHGRPKRSAAERPILAACGSSTGPGDAEPTITVFRDPAGHIDQPSGIIGADGSVWFTSIANHRIGRIRDGKVETFADPAGRVRLPANIFPGADGRVWFTSLGSDALGAIDPEAADPASTIETYRLPDGNHPVALKAGPDGRLWFSLRGSDAIGSIDPRAPDPQASLRVYRSKTIKDPAALFVTDDGRVWWTNANDTIGTLDARAADPQASIAALGPFTGSPRAWAQSDDGRLWLTTREPAGLLSFDPADPAGTALHVTDDRLRQPDGVWFAEGGIWFVDTATNRIGRYQPGGSGSGAWRFTGAPPDVEGPFDIKSGPDPADGSLWFTNKAGNSIGRIATGDQP